MTPNEEARGKEDKLGARRPWQALAATEERTTHWQTDAQDRLLKYVEDDLRLAKFYEGKQWDKDLRVAMEKQATYGTAIMEARKTMPPIKNGVDPFVKSLTFGLGKGEIDEIMKELARGRPGGIIAMDVESVAGHRLDVVAFDEFYCDGPSRQERLLLLCK